MFYASDNTGPAHPSVMDALQRANKDYTPSYGDDALMGSVREAVRETFEAPDAEVLLVATGTAANALSLAALTRQWQTIYCADIAHIETDECGAPEQFSGARLTLLDAPDGKYTPAALQHAIENHLSFGVHGVQPGSVTLTQATETGTLYSTDEIAAIADVARSHNLPLHMDGARFANAVAALGCTPAEMSWKAGVTALSFGGTKNGLLGVEAIILFDPTKIWELELLRKRTGHLFSKHRFLSAQMHAYLSDGLWLRLAEQANAAAALLEQGLRTKNCVEFDYRRDVNIIFARWPRHVHQALRNAGSRYLLQQAGELGAGNAEEMVPARLVCDWSARAEGRARFLSFFPEA